MSNDDDIKDILDRAFTPEPALTLDREEVFRRGHRQVRHRRIAASGGVVLSVVAVVLGVAALTGVLRKGPIEDAAPALTTGVRTVPSSNVEVAPPGPQLPLAPTASAPMAPSADEHAAVLTKVLSSSGVVPGAFKVLAAEPDTTPLEFQFTSGFYRTSALLVDGKGRGVLVIAVWPARRGDLPPKCLDVKDCAEVNELGVDMAARTARSGSGAVQYSVTALRPDSTLVTLLASNVATTAVDDSRTTRVEPPVDLKQLRVLAALPGLAYG